MTGHILQDPVCTTSSQDPFPFCSSHVGYCALCRSVCLQQLVPGLLCMLQLMSGDILEFPCPAPYAAGCACLLQLTIGRPCWIAPCPTAHKASEVALYLHLQGSSAAGSGGRRVLLVPSPQRGHGRGDRAQRGRGRGQRGRGRGQEARGGRGAGGRDTVQPQQLQAGLDSKALLLVLGVSTGYHMVAPWASCRNAL